jgi:hypothetical protein
MKMKIIILGLLICSQVKAQNSEKQIINEDKSYAEKYLRLALNNYSDRTKMSEKLISKRESAISYAELIL